MIAAAGSVHPNLTRAALIATAAAAMILSRTSVLLCGVDVIRIDFLRIRPYARFGCFLLDSVALSTLFSDD